MKFMFKDVNTLYDKMYVREVTYDRIDAIYQESPRSKELQKDSFADDKPELLIVMSSGADKVPQIVFRLYIMGTERLFSNESIWKIIRVMVPQHMASTVLDAFIEHRSYIEDHVLTCSDLADVIARDGWLIKKQAKSWFDLNSLLDTTNPYKLVVEVVDDYKRQDDDIEDGSCCGDSCAI